MHMLFSLYSLLLLLPLARSLLLPSSPLGTALKPINKKTVAVIGAGGTLGSTIFGFLQRSSSLFPYGVSATKGSPRAITATAVGSKNVLSCLSSRFVLAYSPESNFALTDFSDGEAIQARLENFDYAVISTRYKKQQARVVPGSYEPPNKTGLVLEPLMEADSAGDVQPLSLTMKAEEIERDDGSVFRLAAVAADRSVRTKHVVVIGEAGSVEDAKESVAFLQKETSTPFTFIFPGNEQLTTAKGW